MLHHHLLPKCFIISQRRIKFLIGKWNVFLIVQVTPFENMKVISFFYLCRFHELRNVTPLRLHCPLSRTEFSGIWKRLERNFKTYFLILVLNEVPNDMNSIQLLLVLHHMSQIHNSQKLQVAIKNFYWTVKQNLKQAMASKL